jgi:hypothetical protein
MSDQVDNNKESDDSVVDAISAVVLIVVFVSACIFWISGQ